MSRAARRARRAKLFRDQDERCHYCRGQMRLVNWPESQFQPADMITLEHVVQRADGGTYGDDNTVGACAGCNVARPNGMDSDVYLRLRVELLSVWPACSPITAQARKVVQKAAPQSIYRIAHGAAA